MKPICKMAMAPEEVTVRFRRPREAKKTGKAKQANHLRGETPLELAVQFPVIELPRKKQELKLTKQTQNVAKMGLYNSAYQERKK